MGGKSLGITPLTTSLAPGDYELQVGTAPNLRNIKVNVTAGTSIVQRVEFADQVRPSSSNAGGLRVQTEPTHLPVPVDGQPAAIAGGARQSRPGDHEIGSGPAAASSAGRVDQAARDALVDRVLRRAGEPKALSPPGG